MPPPPPPSPPVNAALPDDIIVDIFLRLPPDEPACLVRASLVSKPWFGLLTGPAFRSRYREFHGASPMLGFLYSWPLYSGHEKEDPVQHFVSSTKFGARIPDDGWGRRKYAAWDCRHGRVLLGDKNRETPRDLVVWDPMNGRRKELRVPGEFFSHGAAVLCAVTGCDHRACHEGPFRVVFFGIYKIHGGVGSVASVRVSLPETGEWNKPCSGLRVADIWSKMCPGLDLATEAAYIVPMPPVLIRDALYFMVFDDNNPYRIIGFPKDDLVSNCLLLIDAPPAETDPFGNSILMAMEDGCLGFAHLTKLTFNLWSRKMDSDGVGAWTQLSVIDLKELIPIQNPKEMLRLIESSYRFRDHRPWHLRV